MPEAAALTGAERLDDAVAEGVAVGLLDPDAGVEVAFTHDLVRRACYTELSAGRRRAAHARLAEIVAPRGRLHAEVAHHLRRAGDEGRARSFLVAAASDARALGALDQAAGFLREAAGSAETAGEAAAGGEAWLALAEIEAWRGDRPAMDAAFAPCAGGPVGRRRRARPGRGARRARPLAAHHHLLPGGGAALQPRGARAAGPAPASARRRRA